jgi:hypothetical protein
VDTPNGDVYARRLNGPKALDPDLIRPIKHPRLHPLVPSREYGGCAICFDLPEMMSVTVEVFDLAGRVVRTLAANETLAVGAHELVWDGASVAGTPVQAGIYLVRVTAGAESATGKLVLLR